MYITTEGAPALTSVPDYPLSAKEPIGSSRIKPAMLLDGEQDPPGDLIARVVNLHDGAKGIIRGKIIEDGPNLLVVPTHARVLGGGILPIPTCDLRWTLDRRHLALRTAYALSTRGMVECAFATWCAKTFACMKLKLEETA